MFMQTNHQMFIILVGVSVFSFFGLAVTGNAWFWIGSIGGAMAAYKAAMGLPFDHPLRIYLRGRVDAWF